MQSWVIDKAKSISIVQHEQEDVNLHTHARVKIARASLCQSDYAIYKGKLGQLPLTPSRSALGFISESKNPALSKGQRVYLSPYVEQDKTLSIIGRDMDGYLSDFSVVSQDNIYPLPESIPDEDFTFIEEIAMAIKTCSLIDIKQTHYVVLFGATDFNIIVGELALYYQAIPIILDSNEEALSVAEQHGIYYTINVTKEDPVERIIEITSGNMAEHLVIDADRLPELDQDLLKLGAKNAKVAFVGFDITNEKLKLNANYIINKRLSIYGINDGFGEIEPAINMLATGVIDVGGLLDKMYDFTEVDQAFASLSSKRPPRFKNIIRC